MREVNSKGERLAMNNVTGTAFIVAELRVIKFCRVRQWRDLTQLKQYSADAPYQSKVTKTTHNHKFEAQILIYSERCVTPEAC